MTAAALSEARVLRGGEDFSMCAVITVGLENAVRAGDAGAAARPGTINAIFLCDAPLRDAAAIELIALAGEAKASALIEAGVRTPNGGFATGTSTDAVVVAWRRSGRSRLKYAGTATAIGALVANLMRQALASARSG